MLSLSPSFLLFLFPKLRHLEPLSVVARPSSWEAPYQRDRRKFYSELLEQTSTGLQGPRAYSSSAAYLASGSFVERERGEAVGQAESERVENFASKPRCISQNRSEQHSQRMGRLVGTSERVNVKKTCRPPLPTRLHLWGVSCKTSEPILAVKMTSMMSSHWARAYLFVEIISRWRHYTSQNVIQKLSKFGRMNCAYKVVEYNNDLLLRTTMFGKLTIFVRINSFV